MSREDYIARFSEVAIQEMQKTGIPASITLAQGLLESDNGNSMLAIEANNHFGIKCHSSWEGKRIFKDDDKKNECFRVYESAWESFRDHSNFLVNGSRYDFLFDYKTTDYKSWAKGLRQAGYATNPKYPDLLIKIIEDNNLNDLDKGIKRVKPVAEEVSEQRANPVNQEQGASNNGISQVVVKVQKSDNGIKYIDMPHAESIRNFAYQLEMSVWQLKKYNNVDKGHEFQKGDRLYLQPKKGRASTSSYKTKKGDTPESISQAFGYKLKKLLKDNNALIKGQVIEEGTEIQLNTKVLPF